MDYIPFITDEISFAFLQATETLVPDVQKIIWTMYLLD